jgi:hypothetical protein
MTFGSPGSTLPDRNDSGSMCQTVSGMIRYWELRRIWYNVALSVLVIGWVVGTWPHFQPALTLNSLGKVVILAVLANVCYSTAYVVDITVQASTYSPAWRRRWRAVLWIAGTLFALLVAQYWIGDEIYPDVHGP